MSTLDTFEPSTMDKPLENNVDNSSTTSREKHVEGISDDQYPQGYKLVLLAGATVIAVFLIALDQVSTSFSHPNILRVLLRPKTSRPSSAQQYPRLQTSSMA